MPRPYASSWPVQALAAYNCSQIFLLFRVSAGEFHSTPTLALIGSDNPAYLLGMERIQYLGQTILKWKVGASSFLALPEKGARLMNWNITLGDGSVRDVVYWPELGSLDDFPKIRGGNPILFPFCARTYDRGDLNFWRADDGERRPMPMHGFARQGAFRVTRLDEGGFSAVLVPDAEAKVAYPYDYEFVVSYRFEPTGLYVELQLTNHGPTPIPWSAGHHFYFTLPWSPGLTRRNYVIDVPATQSWRHNESGRLVDGPRLNQVESLDNPQLIDAIQTGLRGHSFAVTERDSKQRLRFNTAFSNAASKDAAVVTWTKDEMSPFYCIEPWMGPPNSAENKTGLHLVGAGQTQKFCVEVFLG